MAFEHLRRTDDDKGTDKNGEKALDPEYGPHRDAPLAA